MKLIKNVLGVIAAGTFLWLPLNLFAAGSEIRFQGRLTDASGQPITGTTEVKFEVYDALENGNLLWPVLPVDGNGVFSVTTNDAGLFETDIGPFQPNFFSGSPDCYIQIYVDDFGFQPLSPRKKFNTVPYAFHSKVSDVAAEVQSLPPDSVDSTTILNDSVESSDIKDETVTSNDIDDGSIQTVDLNAILAQQLIPSGMIAMFDQTCPAGWTRYSALDNYFPIGVDSYTGVPGGATAISGLSMSAAGGHGHTVNSHTHGSGSLATGQEGWGGFWASGSGSLVSFHGHTHPISGNTGASSPGTSSAGSHTHSISSDGSWLPPHLGMVFCKKD